MRYKNVTFDDIKSNIKHHVDINSFKNIDCIVGVVRGGVVPATITAYHLDIKEIYFLQISSYTSDVPGLYELYEKIPLDIHKIMDKSVLFIDDIADTGSTIDYISKTYTRYTKSSTFYTCFYKEKSIVKPNFYGELVNDDIWVKFPWEL